MNIDNFVILLLNYSHVIFSLIILIIMCFKFPEEVKSKDPDWLRNNIGHIIGSSFGIGGFLTLSIGLCLLGVNGSWPDRNTNRPPITICEYLPFGGGPFFVSTIVLLIHILSSKRF